MYVCEGVYTFLYKHIRIHKHICIWRVCIYLRMDTHSDIYIYMSINFVIYIQSRTDVELPNFAFFVSQKSAIK